MPRHRLFDYSVIPDREMYKHAVAALEASADRCSHEPTAIGMRTAARFLMERHLPAEFAALKACEAEAA